MLGQIFRKARQEAPCYLVFEDLDSIVSDTVRSFFLNEVDGLSNNDGILMVGSTNHLEQLDPGISKRPSRFDRKYYFPVPDKEERIKYCEYWQDKLSDSKDIDFPHRLCSAIADITDCFSFAYLQEAFVATLLVIAAHKDKPIGNGWNQRKGVQMWEDSSDHVLGSAVTSVADDDLDKFVLWREIKVQIKILREGLEEKEAHPEVQPDVWKGCRHPVYPPRRSISRNKAILDFAKLKAAHPSGLVDVEGRDMDTKNFGAAASGFCESRRVSSGAVEVFHELSPAIDGMEWKRGQLKERNSATPR
jgi:ATPase family associated with various cellular activities (AAA)